MTNDQAPMTKQIQITNDGMKPLTLVIGAWSLVILGLGVDHDRLLLRHLLDGVLGAFLAEAAVAEAAVGDQVGPPGGAPVDVQVAGIDLAGKADRGVDVLRKNA